MNLKAFWLASILGTASLGGSATASTYNAATDFSATNNPNGAWTYGAQQVLGGALTPYTRTKVDGGLSIWYEVDTFLIFSQVWGIEPIIAYDGVSDRLSVHPGVITYPYDLYDNLPYSVLRWTAPASGVYEIDATFFGMFTFDFGTTTDVHVLLNNSPLLNAYVVGASAQQTFSGTWSLAAGDTLDFAVGPATDVAPLYDYQGDMTGLSVIINQVSEPITLTLFCIGLAGLGAVRRKKLIA